MSDTGLPLPKFGEWDVNDPASAEGFTAIFNKARDEKKTGSKPESEVKADTLIKSSSDPVKPPPVPCKSKCGRQRYSPKRPTTNYRGR